MPVSLSSNKDIVVNGIGVMQGNRIVDVLETISTVTGLANQRTTYTETEVDLNIYIYIYIEQC